MNKRKIRLISILGAIATVLTVIICVSAFMIAKKATDNFNSDEPEIKDTSEYIPPVYNDGTKDEEQTTKEEETTTAPPTVEKSLEYKSNGNGTCTLIGVGDLTDSCIIIPEKSPAGEVVTTIGKKAFYNNASINAVQIPSTVTHIEEMAFGGCTSLIYISVSTDNKSFTDKGGILFSLDEKTLIHYPALRGNDTLNIPASVTEISAMAFYGCSSLKYISYDGEVTDWAKIKIGESNYSLYAISIQCKGTK